jgi:hypothetical protein
MTKTRNDPNFTQSDIDPGLDVTPPVILPFEIPDKFINIPDSVIKSVDMYMAIVIKRGKPGRDVEVKKIFENTKMMFRDGIKHQDRLWIHHCASSFREIINFLEPEMYRLAFSSIPKEGSDPKVESIFNFLDKALTYLSDIVHFRESIKLGNYEKLYPLQGYGQMNKDEFLKQEELHFEKVCIDVVYTLNQLFCDYCIGK